MACKHEGFYSATAHYDRGRAQLIYVMTCDLCRAHLQEVRREPYRPLFDREGCERFLAADAHPGASCGPA